MWVQSALSNGLHPIGTVLLVSEHHGVRIPGVSDAPNMINPQTSGSQAVVLLPSERQTTSWWR